jgi:hypothetical protein
MLEVVLRPAACPPAGTRSSAAGIVGIPAHVPGLEGDWLVSHTTSDT